MLLSLNRSQLQTWLRQQDGITTSPYALSDGVTLSYHNRSGRDVFELEVAQSLTSNDWLDDVLARRYHQFARYHRCFPIRKTQSSWVLQANIAKPITVQSELFEQALLSLLSLAGLEII